MAQFIAESRPNSLPELEESDKFLIERSSDSPLSSIRAPSSPPSSRNSSPEIHTPLPSLSSAHFSKFFKNCAVSPQLSGIEEEADMQNLFKLPASISPMGRGKDRDITTLTHFEALPELPETSFAFEPSKDEILRDAAHPSTIEVRPISLGSCETSGRKPLVESYTPQRALMGKEDDIMNIKIPKQKSDAQDMMAADEYILPDAPDENCADFVTAPASPDRRDFDGSYEMPVFSSGKTINDFARLPDRFRGPVVEVSPRTSVLDTTSQQLPIVEVSPGTGVLDKTPQLLPISVKFMSMNMGDAFMDSSPVAVRAKSEPACLEQSDGPVPVPVPGPVGEAADVLPVPENPLDKHIKRKDKAVNGFRRSVRKSRKIFLRTPVLVVMVGSELAGPTKLALNKIGSGLPSGFGEVPAVAVPDVPVPSDNPVPGGIPVPGDAPMPEVPEWQDRMPLRLRNKFNKLERERAAQEAERRETCCDDMED